MTDKNSYDNFSLEYKISKQLTFRKSIEEYTLFQILGHDKEIWNENNIKNLKILDLACGEGIYSRKLKEKGVSTVIGVDLSDKMIELAKETERKNPLGCIYLVHDALVLPVIDSYDFVIGMYLLNYARTIEELLQFCNTAYKNLKPGGKFIGLNDNPMNDKEYYDKYQKYGFIKKTTDDRKEGDPITYIITNLDGKTFNFDNYYMSPESYKYAFEMSGFSDFKWITPYLDPEYNNEKLFWDFYLTYSPMIGFSATKPMI